MAFQLAFDADFLANPTDDDQAKDLATMILQTRLGLQERINAEHYFTVGGTQARHGTHIKGSAVSYVQTSAPSVRPDGSTALDANDNGRLWIDTSVSPYILNIYEYPNWVPVATSAVNYEYMSEKLITNFGTNTSEPLMAAEAVVAVGGSSGLKTFTWASNTTITGWSGISDATWAYIQIAYADGTASWTSTAPVWDETYKGFYTANGRVIGGAYRTNSTTWTYKFIKRNRRDIDFGASNKGLPSGILYNIFTSGSSFTVPWFIGLCLVYAIGGGGGGGSADDSAGGAGGGGGGGVAMASFDLSETASVSYTIGGGGAGGSGSGSDDGDAGGTTTFGSWLTANGGGGGQQSAGGVPNPNGGAGGSASASSNTISYAYYTATGNAGAGTTTGTGGAGGSTTIPLYSTFAGVTLTVGTGGAGGVGNANGSPGTGYGAGGGGAADNNGDTNPGGAGSQGAIYLFIM